MTGDWSWEHFYTCDLTTFYFNPSIGGGGCCCWWWWWWWCCCCCCCCVVVVVAAAAAAAAAGDVALFCFCLFVSWGWEGGGLLVVFVFRLFVVLKWFCGCCCCCVLLGGWGGGGEKGRVMFDLECNCSSEVTVRDWRDAKIQNADIGNSL